LTHYTAEIPYYPSGNHDSYYFSGQLSDGTLVEEIHIGSERLSAIIHEINECELTHLLEDKFGEEMQSNVFFEVTKKTLKQMKRNFKGEKIFTKIRDRVFITHLISPYGEGNCFMPRKKYRAIW
jgi:uncharacterized protein YpbB